MLEALVKTMGIVTPACKQVGISRQTFYDWYEKDEDFKRDVDDLNEVRIDFVEGKLFEGIQNGNTALICFYLKTQAKHRGYIEKQQIEHSGNIGPDLSEEAKKRLQPFLDD